MQSPIDVRAWFQRASRNVEALKRSRADAVRQSEAETPLTAALTELFIKNTALWDLEDEIRRTDLPDAEIARIKRRIDCENQLRNDAMDRADALLREAVERSLGAPDPGLPINTETPGSAFDRLTILALRAYHLDLEAGRRDATPAHRQRSRDRLSEVRERTEDLLQSLSALLEGVFSGQKRLKSYSQHKLYNDPETNPALRKTRRPSQGEEK
ncbi:MAG: DUF4254 domain-containing protein [Planctomycetota bacterium]